MPDTEGKKPSIYDRLDHEHSEIRMLTIQPDSPEATVRCTLEKTSLINPTEYAALSYCWGDPKITASVTVNDVAHKVTVNLAQALRQLRAVGVSRLWADALCINQNDDAEKGHQIRLMKHIYSRASGTYAWMSEDVTVGDAIFFLQTILLEQTKLDNTTHSHPPLPAHQEPIFESSTPAQRRDKPNGCQRCLFEKDFQALSTLFAQEYWKRRWILQEIAAASKVIVACGNDRIVLDDMLSAIEKCRASCYWLPEVKQRYYYFERVLRFRELYQANKRPLLCDAIQMSQHSRSADARDKVFALLGICEDGTDLVPEDLAYQFSVEVIVSQISKALMRKTSCLDLLLINSFKEYEDGGLLPGWAPNWLAEKLPPIAYTLARRLLSSREVVVTDDLPLDSGILRVRGTVLSTIKQITTPVAVQRRAQDPTFQGAGPQVNPLKEESSVAVYYSNERIAFNALVLCFTGNLAGQSPESLDADCFRTALCTILGRAGSASRKRFAHEQKPFNEWLDRYRDFPIHDTTLKESLTVSLPTRLFVRIFNFKFISLLCVFLYIGFYALLIRAIFIRRPMNDFTVYDQFLVVSFALMTLGFLPVLIMYTSCRGCMQRINKMQTDLCEKFAEFVSRRERLLISESGVLGTTSAGEAQDGDQICLLDGLSSAVILRRVLGDSEEVREKHKIVGAVELRFTKKDSERKQERSELNGIAGTSVNSVQHDIGEIREFDLI